MITQQDIDELKITYKVISKIMKEEHLTKDTAFVHVKNYIANKLCELI